MHLAAFLVKAKKHTYASPHAKKILLEDGAYELTYTEGEWTYRDRYYGDVAFSGQEVVWHNNKPVWSMNYYGRTEKPLITQKELIVFLKEALAQVTEEAPFRGPTLFTQGELTYTHYASGSVKAFAGTEAIAHNGTIFYTLAFHGGNIEGKEN
jgi:hypothetical protein